MRRKSRNESLSKNLAGRLRPETFVILNEKPENGPFIAKVSDLAKTPQTKSTLLTELNKPGLSPTKDLQRSPTKPSKGRTTSPTKTLPRMATSPSRMDASSSLPTYDLISLDAPNGRQKRKKTLSDGKSSPSPPSPSSSAISLHALNESFSSYLDYLKSLKKETICSLISLGLQVALFTTSVLVAIITFKHLKYPDPGSVFACVLYIDGSVQSPSCFSIETIFFISALGTILIFLFLLGFLFFKVKRTRTFYVIGISIGIFCGFLTFIAACLYEVGLKTTIDYNGGKEPYIQRYSDRIDVNLVDMGRNAAWFTTITWMIYAGVEFYESLSYLSGSEYEVFIEEYK